MDRYLEALEQARNYYPDNLFLDTIFPELAESEDERTKKELLSFIESVQHSYLCATDRRKKWIAYLEKQKEQNGSLRVIKDASEWEKIKEQKPEEWSEEDEVELINIVDFLNSPSTAELCPALRKKAIAWLKSLRPQPHWKPSEEQIRRLNNVIITDSRIWGVETKRAMMSLYEDLKKL